MAIASVKAPFAPIYQSAAEESIRVDEALYGMSIQILDEIGADWAHVRTDYHLEGYVPLRYLQNKPDVASSWAKYPKYIVLSPWADIQQEPAAHSALKMSIPRGSMVVALGVPNQGWQKVGLVDGKTGYTRFSYLGEAIANWGKLTPADMRWNIVETALSYNGTAYRVGGRTPEGIDEVGLAAMAYYINGVMISRKASLQPGMALHAIEPEQMDEGDVLYFRDGIGVYMGEGKYVHATQTLGQEGVLVSSLDPQDENFRPDLADQLVSVGSLF